MYCFDFRSAHCLNCISCSRKSSCCCFRSQGKDFAFLFPHVIFLMPILSVFDSVLLSFYSCLCLVSMCTQLYIWQYNSREVEVASPAIVLKTRRSLRAVHFHPHGAPLLLTAEVSITLLVIYEIKQLVLFFHIFLQ